jgi:hypothetical protein
MFEGANEDACRSLMLDMLELKDGQFRAKMVGYEKHRINNVNIVKKIIKTRGKQDGNESKISL